MLAIWFAHQDIPSESEVPGAGVYFRLINMANEEEVFREKIKNDFANGMTGSNHFNPSFVMIITWKNMTFPNRKTYKKLKVRIGVSV